jgi:hypothetical protein
LSNGEIAFRTIKEAKGNKGLLDNKRFEGLQREKRRWLRTLSWKKAIRLAEDMLSCPLIDEWLADFPEDNLVCLKIALKRRRKA